MFSFYNSIIFLYTSLIYLSSTWNKKARTWVRGRRDLFEKLEKDLTGIQRVAWFHAASLGEFEQGRPVIEGFRKKYPEMKILLTFFSPSGYEVRKNYPGADYIYYLPPDFPRNAKRFISIVKPEISIFIKYEFWFNYLHQLAQNKVPVYYISSIFREDQHFFKSYGSWFRKQLLNVTGFFVQDKHSQDLLNSIGLNNVRISGDTRFDRVSGIAKNNKKDGGIEKFVGKNKVILAGSTWPPDEKLLLSYFQSTNKNLKLIIAPHEIHTERIDSILELFAPYKPIKYSQLAQSNSSDSQVCVIDGMGFLSNLYQYCDLALIGGGFGKGIHNILEAVTFGKPVVFGPNYNKFAEARNLIKAGGAFPINEDSIKKTIDGLIQNDQAYKKASQTCLFFIRENTGATQIILDNISETHISRT